jgi:imidazolonepropionase-like amidohydrolase
LIESVGETVRVPADARVIDGTGLTVYPGFIDSNTSLALSAPRQTGAPGQPQVQQTAQQAPQTNSNFPNGLQPETTAAEQLRAGDAQFESIRNFGFTTALTVSRDGIFNGQSALINLTGDTVSEMIVADPVAMHVTFRTLGGGTFPTSLMGTFAALRQMMLDAQRLQQVKKMYDANPRGIPRPQSDRSLEALLPVLNRTMPVAFNANTEREIIRALDLTKEFNLKAMIVGGQEAWKVADRLKAQNIPVLLSLNFPKRTTSSSPEADPESLDVLRMRVEIPKGAARLAQAGVKFAFQNGGMTNLGDFLTNAAKTVENGLTRDAAIRAMTLTPAEIFGVDNRLGSIEKGKIANLVVSRGDVLAKDKTITHVFVDGRLFEQKAPQQQPTRPTTTTPGTTPAFASVNGNWSVTIEIPNQPLPAIMNLVQDGRNLSGTMQFQNNTVQIKDGEVTNDGFRFSATVQFEGNAVPIVVAGRVTGNQMTGTVTAPPGAIPFSGTRNP